MIRSTRIQRILAPLVCVVLMVPDVAVANCSLLAGNAAVTPDSRFSDNGNGTITDTGTALMWTKSPIAGGPYTQPEAQTEADASTVGSHVDWRLPTRAELGSIIETGCSNPALNTTFFTLGASTTFWTAETAGAAGFGVDFTHGISQTEPSDTPKAVRLVRSLSGTIFSDSFE